MIRSCSSSAALRAALRDSDPLDFVDFDEEEELTEELPLGIIGDDKNELLLRLTDFSLVSSYDWMSFSCTSIAVVFIGILPPTLAADPGAAATEGMKILAWILAEDTEVEPA